MAIFSTCLALKKYAEGEISNKVEAIDYFDYVCSNWSKKYQRLIGDKIKSSLKNGNLDDTDYNIITAFINELLANGNNYLYLNFMIKVYKQGKFSSCEAFLDYLMCGNLDSFDILLPITNLSLKDQKLFELKEQKIIIENDITYCKVYGNNISDFYHLIKDNILRIESLFNILRFYSNSKIDFLKERNILVYSKYVSQSGDGNIYKTFIAIDCIIIKYTKKVCLQKRKNNLNDSKADRLNLLADFTVT